jgi:hypothetical protein
VLEDCAHVAGIRVGSARAGDYGDAALFSLPKVIPARAGAVLRTREPFRLPPMDEARSSMTMEGKAVAENFPPDRLNALREERHQFCGVVGLPSWSRRSQRFPSRGTRCLPTGSAGLTRAHSRTLIWGASLVVLASDSHEPAHTPVGVRSPSVLRQIHARDSLPGDLDR